MLYAVPLQVSAASGIATAGAVSLAGAGLATAAAAGAFRLMLAYWTVNTLVSVLLRPGCVL